MDAIDASQSMGTERLGGQNECVELGHELDLTRFAPLAPEQVYHLFRAAHRPELLKRSDLETVWECVALYVNSNCAELPPVLPQQLREIYTQNAGSIRSHFHKYSLWAQVFPDDWFTFMNYGYHAFADASALSLSGAEMSWPRAAAMYHHVASRTDLHDKDVLEVGCGRGGGAAYIARRFATRSLLASDGTRSNVGFCRRVHDGIAGLRFMHARAEALPFDEGAFDAIINIESCRYYEPFSAFASGVVRALRPGGHLLIAFYASLDDALTIRRALLHAGLQLEKEEDISANVLAAMSLMSGKELIALLERSSTVRCRHHYYELLSGAYNVEALASGRSRYFCAAYRKS